MLRLTLDTSSVLHGVLGQDYGAAVDEHVDLARAGRVELSITTAFAVDQERASADRHERNLAWLSERPLIGTVPGPCRRGYSGLGGPDVLSGEEHAAADVSRSRPPTTPAEQPVRGSPAPGGPRQHAGQRGRS